MKVSTALSLTCLSLFLPALALEVGETICSEGFIMDSFCIDRGTLFDNPSAKTLENPEKHSVHCLVDVNSCINSPFEVLLDPLEPGGMYLRGWRLTEDSKQTVIALARSVGTSCSTCNGGGDLQRGFRAVLSATIVDLNEGLNIPPLIQISGAEHSNDLEDACRTVFNLTDVLDTINRTSFGVSGSGSNLQQKHLIHGSLMLIGWGFLLPSGTLFAKFFKHRPDALWFRIHRACQITGLCIAVIGWIIALKNFEVWGDKGDNNYRHGLCGSVTMILGLLQPVNAIVRPHPPTEGESATTGRKLWEIVHKSVGYIAVLLAIVTIGLGTTILPDVEDQRRFQLAYGIGCGGMLFLLFVAIQQDKANYPEAPPEDNNKLVEEGSTH